MRNTPVPLVFSKRALILLVALVALGCSKSSKKQVADVVEDVVIDTFDPNAPIELEEGIVGVTLSRVGRPRIAELFFHDDQANFDEFNSMSPDKDNTNPTAGHSKTTLDAYLALSTASNPLNLSGLDPQFGDIELSSSYLHNLLILSGNVLTVDLDGTNRDGSGTFVAVTEGLLAVELGFKWTASKKPAFGGRGPGTDALNVMLTLLTNGEITTDKVDANDRPYRQEFPYLPEAQ